MKGAKTVKLKEFSKKSTPYFLIFVLSLIGTFLVFRAGLNRGDDFFYHIPNILDKYNSILSGRGLVGISSEIGNGFGYGAGLFYSPLSHFTVAVLGVFLNLFGISLMATYKIVIVLSVFVSGVFMYGFAMKFTNGKRVASLLASACLVIYPYRLFNLFCRIAFAEAFAFVFMPLFFAGIYEVTHLDKEKIKIMPFIKIVIGASLLFLSHNITALFAFIFGFILFFVYSKRLLKLFSNPKFGIYCAASALLIIGVSAIALFSQLELLGMDYYAVSNDVSMRTDIDSVLNHVGKEWNYSGFLNVSFLSGYGITSSFLYSGIFIYLFGCAIFVIIDTLLAKIQKLKHFHYVISATTFFIIISLVAPRLEGYLGGAIFVSLYLFVSLVKDAGTENTPIYKNPLFWFSLAVIFISIFAMRSEKLWQMVPGFLRTIQFPWRLWSFVQMFLSVVVGLVASHYASKKNVLTLIAAFVGLLMLLNMPTIEKRNAPEDKWVGEISHTCLDKSSAIGHQKEYCPQVYREAEYVPRENSLYDIVRMILKRSNYSREDKISPVILSGDGKIAVNSNVAPKIDMRVELSEVSEIQLPLFYYPGYRIIAISDNGEQIVTPYEVDGLVTFKLLKGVYTIKTEFVGSPLRISGKVLTIASSFVMLGILSYAVCTETSLKRVFTKNNKKART